MNVPYYLLRGGYLFDISLSFAGFGGYYWSSTPSSSNYAYSLSAYSGNTIMNYYDRYYGQSVRCVAVG